MSAQPDPMGTTGPSGPPRRGSSRLTTRRAFVAASAAAVLLLSACGSSGTKSGGSTASGGSTPVATTVPAASGPAAQGITAKTITLGFDSLVSGPIAPEFVGADDYFKAWMDSVNASGGIDGRQVKIVELDSAGNPAQALSNYKTLWQQDRVAAMIEGGISTPDAYIKSESVPTFTNGASPEDYASANTTVFPTVGTIEEWAAEAAYFTVKIAHKHPASVGVLTTGMDPEFDPYIKAYWAKLGVTKLDVEQGGAPGASCSSDVLKWKSLNVDYVDMLDTEEFPACLQAEAQLGWKPALGQGGIGASTTRTAEQVGEPFNGVVGGAPDVSYLGSPLYSAPTPALRTYVANVDKYAPKAETGMLYLNSAIDSGYYSIAQVVTQVLSGALEQYGSKLTTAELVSYTQGMKNTVTSTVGTIQSLTPSCKSGSSGTFWGYWHYQAASKTVVFEPASGKTWVSSDFIGGPCYLTQYTSKLFPKG